MNDFVIFLRKHKAVIITFLVLLFIYFTGKHILTNYVLFSVTNVTPSSLSTANTNLSFSFSKTLDGSTVSKDSVVVEPEETQYVVESEDKKILIFFREAFSSDTKVKVSLNDIRSDSGNSISKVYEFDVEYRPAGSLSDEEIEQNTQRSNSFETRFPLIKSLPIIDPVFEVSFQFPNSEMPKLPLIITAKTATPQPRTLYGDYIPLDTADPDVNRYKKEVRQSRTRAIEYLEGLEEYSPDKYELYFAEPVLINEFPGKYVEDL